MVGGYFLSLRNLFAFLLSLDQIIHICSWKRRFNFNSYFNFLRIIYFKQEFAKMCLGGSWFLLLSHLFTFLLGLTNIQKCTNILDKAILSFDFIYHIQDKPKLLHLVENFTVAFFNKKLSWKHLETSLYMLNVRVFLLWIQKEILNYFCEQICNIKSPSK